MEVRAVEKYIRISPKKARLVVDVVRGQNAVSALTTLKFMPKKAAGIIYKALNSAISNAVNNHGLMKNDLVITKITVDSGPSLKRFRPRSKGMASPLLKRTSHITVVVAGEEPKQIAKAEKIAKAEVKVAKKEVKKAAVASSVEAK
jgi:large subunit ribosomal protein L22